MLDEPEQHLDAEGQDLLVGVLAGLLAEGRAVVFWTHLPILGVWLSADDLMLG
jgi:ABC-type protease/lipase transport system fused ATPase/permease subunit